MKQDNELTDTQIAGVIKAALDNNAAIVQYCSFIYGNSRDVKQSTRSEWHKALKKQWESYSKQVEKILSINEN